MQRFLALLLSFASLGPASVARADDAVTCGDAFDQSQVQRDAGRLLAARKLLRICQAPSCSPTQQRLCSEWLMDVEARVPSFVLSAKDGSGVDLVNVKVTMDGVAVATNLDGRTVDVDPGPHAFVFELADGTKVETQAVADEHAKGKLVAVAFGSPPAAMTATPPAPPIVQQPAPVGEPPSRTSSPLRTAALIAGGAGVIGLAVGTVFGLDALSTKAAHCDAQDRCDPGAAGTATSQGTGSTVAFVAGGALLAAGGALFLLAPKHPDGEGSGSIAIAPTVGPSTGGLLLAGRWW